MSYPDRLIIKARLLRSNGKTFREIQSVLGVKILKSTLSYWLKDVTLPKNYHEYIAQLNQKNLEKARRVAAKTIREKRDKLMLSLSQSNKPIAKLVLQQEVGKIALAMLCLGEASKYNSKTQTFALGNSDPRIIILFLSLLKLCYSTFSIEKIRCTVQCRADQNTQTLIRYWQGVTKIPKRLFYKTQIDPRTIGKPTLKKDYKGVLRIDYFDSIAHRDLESLADLVYNQAIVWARSSSG